MLRLLKEKVFAKAAYYARRIQPPPETSAVLQVTQRALYHQYRMAFSSGRPPRLNESGFRNFSAEDGLLLCLFAALDVPRGSFVDIGAADGINSNCANLAMNFGWDGVFIDGNAEQIDRGRAFYRAHPHTAAYPPQFIHARVTRENINELLKHVRNPVHLLSVDIDGNDYWVWEALNVIEPAVVVIEIQCVFGLASVVVPYDADAIYPGLDSGYFGASGPAMVALAKRKGYRLIGASHLGPNFVFVREDLVPDQLPTITVEQALCHPRNVSRQQTLGEAAFQKPLIRI
jgi:hypothetical protein